jgi:hypothetical protein
MDSSQGKEMTMDSAGYADCKVLGWPRGNTIVY